MSSSIYSIRNFQRFCKSFSSRSFSSFLESRSLRRESRDLSKSILLLFLYFISFETDIKLKDVRRLKMSTFREGGCRWIQCARSGEDRENQPVVFAEITIEVPSGSNREQAEINPLRSGCFVQ